MTPSTLLLLALLLLSIPSLAQEQLSNSMLKAVNELRASGCRCGSQKMRPVAPLTWNTKLESAAKRHVKDMETHSRMTHTGSDGSAVGKRVKDAGYQWSAVGENIAEGSESVADVVAMWKESPGHCRNMMSPAYTEMGAARQGDFWAQVFGNDVTAAEINRRPR